MAPFKDRFRKLFRRNINQQQTKTPSSVPLKVNSQQQQPIVQLDGPADAKQKTVKTQSKAATVTGTLQVQLQNRTNSSTVYAYISK